MTFIILLTPQTTMSTRTQKIEMTFIILLTPQTTMSTRTQKIEMIYTLDTIVKPYNIL
ncbi:MAG: hypothetical protein Gaeavirus7_21 [Gaeavirus sp.]|uniref:Uncharacterized protein n=1 Tax=Gaeavirus sp. TaxID=2487767 RepID=A0A3G5A0P7_9VIRU|nr:MAG: hypothetical protein Gaeavirus7_21 [Gaeavirus sp.]